LQLVDRHEVRQTSQVVYLVMTAALNNVAKQFLQAQLAVSRTRRFASSRLVTLPALPQAGK
jgi:hypothetical protein